MTLVDVHQNWSNWSHFLIFEGSLLVILIDCMIFLSPFLDVTRMSTVSFPVNLSFLKKISQPTHILANSSSCIDLIFTDQPNLVTDCGTHSSLHPNCHHQIIYCKLNLRIAYPPLIKD